MQVVEKFKPVRAYDPNWCDKGWFEYKYRWKVNVSGEWGLLFYDPIAKKTYYGWPDGIESN